MRTSISETAFEGLRLTWRRPLVVLSWGLFYLAATALLGGAVLAIALGRTGSLADVDAVVRASWPALIIAVVALLVVFAMLSGAIYRSVLRPDDKRLAYLRIGSVELRLCIVMIVTGMIFALAAVLALIIVGALSQLPAPFGAIAAIIAALALIAGTAWVSVRLSLAGPLTLVRSDLPFGQSWKITKGRFWPLFAAYIIAWLCSVLLAIVASLPSGVLGGEASALALLGGDFTLPSAAFAGLFVYALLQIALSTVQLVVTAAPAAAAYRQIGMRARPEDAF